MNLCTIVGHFLYISLSYRCPFYLSCILLLITNTSFSQEITVVLVGLVWFYVSVPGHISVSIYLQGLSHAIQWFQLDLELMAVNLTRGNLCGVFVVEDHPCGSQLGGLPTILIRKSA